MTDDDSVEVRFGVHAARAGVIESAVIVEAALDDALTAHLARDERARILLRSVLPKLSIRDRLTLLGDLLDQHEYADDFPFLLPTAKLLFNTRNLLAHSIEVEHEVGASLEESIVWVESYNRGQLTKQRLPVSRLHWLAHASRGVKIDLNRLWARGLSDDFLRRFDSGELWSQS